MRTCGNDGGVCVSVFVCQGQDQKADSILTHTMFSDMPFFFSISKVENVSCKHNVHYKNLNKYSYTKNKHMTW